MILRELKTGTNSNVTLSLSYDELRILNSAFYHICKDIEHNSNFCDTEKEKMKDLNGDIFYLFELLKNGHLDHWAIKTLAEKKGIKEEED